MGLYWRKWEKEERERLKRAEKEALAKRKKEEEIREAKRQQRKLNFLLTQTELYTHFISGKLGSASAATPAPPPVIFLNFIIIL